MLMQCLKCHEGSMSLYPVRGVVCQPEKTKTKQFEGFGPS